MPTHPEGFERVVHPIAWLPKTLDDGTRVGWLGRYCRLERLMVVKYRLRFVTIKTYKLDYIDDWHG